MIARAASIAAALFFCHHVMTKGGKYHPPLLFSFCSQYKSKKDIAGRDILDSMHENASMHEIGVMASPLYISEFVHNHVSPFGERGNRSVLRLENKLYLFRALYCVSRANVV